MNVAASLGALTLCCGQGIPKLLPQGLLRLWETNILALRG